MCNGPVSEPTNSEARRLMAQKGVQLNGEVLTADREPVRINEGDVLRRGKRKAVKLAPEKQ